MSKLSQLNTKKEFDINGVKIELESVPIDESTSDLFSVKDGEEGKSLMIISEIIRKQIKQSIPDATEEELNQCMKLRNFLPLVNAFYDVNGMTDKKNMSNAEKIKNALKEKQELRRPKK